MDVVEVLHMNGGCGDTSYSNNSLLQQNVIVMTKPIVEQSLTDLYYAMKCPETLVMADLGCSSGPNTLLVASEFIKIVDNIWLKMGHHQTLEIQIYLNDLPGNDFNAIFVSLRKFHVMLAEKMGSINSLRPSYYFNGVPGSFYTRLFPRKSLHFVHSSYSLMWLSKVPDVGDRNTKNIYMSSSSPKSVIRAYYEQFQRDFLTFLKCRSEEMVSGGRMVLTILGRQNEDPCSKECCHIWELLAMALNDMVFEGLVEEKKMDSFNIPQYTPCPKEVKKTIEKEGSFTLDRVQISQVNWDAYANCNLDSDVVGYNVSKCMRAVAEPLLISHFGSSIIDEVFVRYTNIITNHMLREKTEFVNVTVSMTRKM